MNVETTRRETNRLLRALDLEDLVQFTLDWERSTGYDSIPTIKDHYEYCPSPGCDYFRTNPVEMWFHVHLSRKHLHTDTTILKNLHWCARDLHDLEVDDD